MTFCCISFWNFGSDAIAFVVYFQGCGNIFFKKSDICTWKNYISVYV